MQMSSEAPRWRGHTSKLLSQRVWAGTRDCISVEGAGAPLLPVWGNTDLQGYRWLGMHTKGWRCNGQERKPQDRMVRGVELGEGELLGAHNWMGSVWAKGAD